MRILIRAVILLSILLSANSSVLAKSLDIPEFNKLWDQAFKLKEEGKTNEANDIFYSIGKKFDIDNFKTSDRNKGSYYYYICRAIRTLNYNYNEDWSRRETILYCTKSYNYYEKSGVFKDKKNKSVQAYLSSALGNAHILEFSLHGGKKNLKLGEKHLLIAFKYSKIKTSSLAGLVDVYRHKGNFEKAIKYQKEFLNLYKCYNKAITKKVKNTCNGQKYNLAYLVSLSGKREEAIKILKEVIKEEVDLTKPIDRAITRLALYTEYLSKGNYDLAEKYIYESISLLNPENPKHKIKYYWHLSHLYRFFFIKQYYHESIKGYLNLIKDMKKDLGENSVQLIDPLSGLSLNYLTQKKFKLALQYQMMMLDIINKNKNYNPLLLDSRYAELAQVYHQLKEFKKADKYYSKSLKIAKKKSDNIQIPLIVAAARTKIRLEKFQEAKNLLIKAEKLNSEYHGDNPFHEIGISTEYQMLYRNSKKINEFNEILVKLYSNLSDLSKGLFSEKFNAPIDRFAGNAERFVSTIPNEWYQKSNIFFESETGKSLDEAVIEIMEIVRFSTVNKRIQNIVDRSKDSLVGAEKRKLQDLIIKYEKMPKTSDDPKEKKEIFKNLKLVKKTISDQKELILSKLNISTMSNFSQEILVKDIQKELTNNQAIISYFLGRYELFIVTITKENIIIKRVYEKKDYKVHDNIKKLITQIRKNLKVNEMGTIPKFDFSSSKKLYDLILGPVSNILKDKNELIIIPHKELMSLPFEVLIDQSTDHGSSEKDYSKVNWLGKKYAISYYPSIYSFYNLKKIKFEKAKNDFVGLGDPLLVAKKNKPKDIDYTKLFTRGVANAEEIRNMEELPETADELKSIAKIFKGNSKLYLREDFNEEVIKTINLNDYKIISFATHAVIANEINNIAEPGLILTPPDKPTKINDGILTVSEVEKLNLQSDIVILSACNTAAADGSPNAGGLSGLASAFFQAGTKSILVTHWDVETKSAVKLTTGMFDKMQKTKNLSQALHLSKMDILNTEETSHPLFWAPYVLIGNVTQAIN